MNTQYMFFAEQENLQVRDLDFEAPSHKKIWFSFITAAHYT